MDLQYIKTTIKSLSRCIRQLTEFKQYKLNIKYKPRIEITIINILNRRSDFQVLINKVNKRTLLFDKALRALTKFRTLSKNLSIKTNLKKYKKFSKLKIIRYSTIICPKILKYPILLYRRVQKFQTLVINNKITIRRR